MKQFISILLGAGMLVCGIVFAADHIDAPAVGSLSTGSTAADITDYYAFESPSNPDNYVFVVNVMGLTAPGATDQAAFDPNVMYEINIDNNGDNIEDLVIQSIFRDDQVLVFGPTPPMVNGLNSRIENGGDKLRAMVTSYGASPSIGESSTLKIFAGPRDDPFFMDFFRFVDIVNGAGSALGLEVPPPADGNAYATSFSENGMDTFAGTNVLSVVIEVPKASLGDSPVFSSWVEAKRRS